MLSSRVETAKRSGGSGGLAAKKPEHAPEALRKVRNRLTLRRYVLCLFSQVCVAQDPTSSLRGDFTISDS